MISVFAFASQSTVSVSAISSDSGWLKTSKRALSLLKTGLILLEVILII